MKNLKKIFLSVLLFSFTFLVFHDYVINEINPSSQNAEIVSVSYEKSKENIINSALQVHDKIHAFVALSLTNIHILTSFTFDSKPLDTEKQIISTISFILDRPPLS